MALRPMCGQPTVALLAEGVDRNHRWTVSGREPLLSPSSRRAWIEILLGHTPKEMIKVALLAEGVDRNTCFGGPVNGRSVALLAEGVDRNIRPKASNQSKKSSPSSRRAWIEIPMATPCDQALQVALLAEGVDRNTSVSPMTTYPAVALLAEGVDRNLLGKISGKFVGLSPSSRRAWIEIAWTVTKDDKSYSRPPRGGRG